MLVGGLTGGWVRRFASWLGRHFEEDDERVLASKLSVLLHREG
jgi:hypothetical protein